MIRARVTGIGLIGPGFEGWQSSAPILRGEVPYESREIALAPPKFLSPRERRRTGMTVRLALNVAEEAVARAGIPAQDLTPVFGTANGDGQVIDRLLDSLVQVEKFVSPTQFHNSVHNAAVGYWAIGAASHHPSTCIAAHDFTFPAALIKSLTHVACEQEPVLTVVYDAPFPEPLNAARPMAATPFGVALVLVPAGAGRGLAELRLLGLGDATAEITQPRHSDLAALWAGNPAARALPLLEAMAASDTASLNIRYPHDGHLQIEVAPC